MNSSVRRMIVGTSFFSLTCPVAVAGYMIAGWQLLDAIYMVVITVFGVGYGETKPLDNTALKVFTMGVIIAGCSSAIYVVGGFVIVAVKRPDGSLARATDPNIEIAAGDAIVIMGHHEALPKLARRAKA